jgi:hypothetical protein
MEVESETEMSWTLDGEQENGHRKVAVENLHHAVRVILKG